MPKISIITTTYNHQNYIEKTIQSILDQTISDWELLIGDDSPGEETWEVIEGYVNKYPDKIKARHHKTNKGIIDNTNFLLDKVSKETKYIAFLEGDDLFTANNLEKKIGIFEKYSEVGMVYNNLDFIDTYGKTFYKDFLKKAPFYLKNQTLSKEKFIRSEVFYGSYSTLMIKKYILDKEKINNPTDSKLFGVSDWDLFFRISNKYKSYGIKESLTLYRRHDTNVSRDNLKIFNDLEIQISQYLKIGFIDRNLFNFKMGFISMLRAVSYIENSNKKNGFKELKKSLGYSPFSFPTYKLAIILFLLLPNFLNQKILKIFIKRG